MSVSAAKSRLMQAKNHIEVDRLGEAEAAIEAGEKFLVGLPDEETAGVRGEFAALRAQIAALPSDEDKRGLSAAKNTIRSIRSGIADRQTIGLEEQIKKVQRYLDSVREPHRAEVAADLAAVTAELAAAIAPAAPTTAPVAASAPATASAAITDEEERNLTAARNTIRSIRSRIADRQTMGLDDQIKKVQGYLDNVRQEHRTVVAADLAAVTAELAASSPAVTTPVVSAPAVASSDAAMTDEEERSLVAARNTVRAIRSRLSDRQTMGLDDQIKKAQGYLDKVPEAHRAAVQADLAAVTAEVAAAVAGERGMVMPLAPHAAQAANAPLSDEDHANLSRARGKISSARNNAESGRTENVAYTLDEASQFLDKVPAAAAQAMRAQIEEVRGLAAAAERKEALRRVSEELERHLHGASSDLPTLRFASAKERLDYVDKRLGEADVAAALSTSEYRAYRDRVADGRVRLAAAIKADALERAQPLVIELEQLVESDPFAGQDQFAVNRKMAELGRLRSRITAAVSYVPDGDRDIAAVMQRVFAVDQKIEKCSVAWGKAVLDATVANNWSSVEAAIAGWEAERAEDTKVEGLYEPELPKTRTAIQRTRYLLDDAETKRLRAEHPGDAAIQGPFETAERIFRDASAKWASALERVLDAADKLETPLSDFVLCRPAQLAYGAESVLAGTPERDRLVARARKLDERWKAEVATIMKQRQELYDKLSAEAEQVWPAMQQQVPVSEFDPAALRPGMTYRFDGIYNRCGWEYGSRKYDFAIRYQGVVIGGMFSPAVLKALEYAWYELKLTVNDRIPWNVIAVVEAADKIGMRTTVILRDKSSGLQIGELEEWPLVDCVRVRIVGLHAGPVAAIDVARSASTAS